MRSSFPYPRNASILAQRAFLWAFVAAIVDLHGRDKESGQKFLIDLQLHVRHLMHIIPDSHDADRDGLEALHGHLLQWFQASLDKFSDMTDDEWQQGLRKRSFLKDLFQTFDDL